MRNSANRYLSTAIRQAGCPSSRSSAIYHPSDDDEFPIVSDHHFFDDDLTAAYSRESPPTDRSHRSTRTWLAIVSLATLTGSSLFGFGCYTAFFAPLVLNKNAALSDSNRLRATPFELPSSKHEMHNSIGRHWPLHRGPGTLLLNDASVLVTYHPLLNNESLNSNEAWIALPPVDGAVSTAADEVVELQGRGPLKIELGISSRLPEMPDWRATPLGRSFLNWCKLHRRPYRFNFAETQRRFYIHLDNLKRIDDHNRRYASGLETYSMEPNQFIDLTVDEFEASQLTAKHGPSPMLISSIQNSSRPRKRTFLSHLSSFSNDSLPTNVDWIANGCVTPVKNQKHCGSCWAFSTTGAVEGAICATTGQLISLSEQQLVDCAQPEGNAGCEGGFMDNAFEYILDSGGLCSESAYPYEGIDNSCRAQKCEPVAHIVEFADIPPHDSKAIMAALAIHGPVSAGIEADKEAFQFYHDGVFNLKCGRQLNHAILIVGYGTDSDTNKDFWLVKNSWGPTWGKNGYIKISRKSHHGAGECGILLSPTVPLVEGDHYVKPKPTMYSGHFLPGKRPLSRPILLQPQVDHFTFR